MKRALQGNPEPLLDELEVKVRLADDGANGGVVHKGAGDPFLGSIQGRLMPELDKADVSEEVPDLFVRERVPSPVGLETLSDDEPRIAPGYLRRKRLEVLDRHRLGRIHPGAGGGAGAQERDRDESQDPSTSHRPDSSKDR